MQQYVWRKSFVSSFNSSYTFYFSFPHWIDRTTYVIYTQNNILICIPFPYENIILHLANTCCAFCMKLWKEKPFTDMQLQSWIPTFFLKESVYQWWSFDWRNTERKLKTVRINYYYCSINNWRFHRIRILVFCIVVKKCELFLILRLLLVFL